MGEGGTRALAVARNFDEVFFEVVEHRVVNLALETVVEEDGVVALVVADERSGAGTDEGRVVDDRSGVAGVVGDVAGNTVPLTAVVMGAGHTVRKLGSLDGEPELVGAGVALVDVETVVLVKGEHDVTGVDGAAKELDAVVRVGKDFDVVDGSSGTDATEGEAVDFAGTRVNITTVADGDVTDGAAVVGGSGASVFDDVSATIRITVRGRSGLEALDTVLTDVACAAVVGNRSTAEHDKAAPAAGGGDGGKVGDESICVEVGLGLRLELVYSGHHDGLSGGSGGIDLGTANDHDGAKLVIVLGRCALKIESGVDFSSRLDGQGSTVGDEYLILKDIGVVFGPSGVGGDCVNVRSIGGRVDRLCGNNVDIGCLRHAWHERGKSHEAIFVECGWFHINVFDLMTG